MNDFKDFGIKPVVKSLQGDKIHIDRILNREITVTGFRIEDSKYAKENNDKFLCLQIILNEENRVVFTGSGVLMDMIQRVPENKFPFKTKIIKEEKRYEFT